MVLNEASITLPIRSEQLNYSGALRQINLGVNNLMKPASYLGGWRKSQFLVETVFLVCSRMTVQEVNIK